ncbi:DUF1501 domain-containing protein [Tundrisphaera lichenicola]|uniref:DUF1501 domain-containing protein n=1 Tax=Tundrisphaera lichenicola TaxID=2029860 RepID=UPI003EBB1E61
MPIDPLRNRLSRRTFLVASGLGLAGSRGVLAKASSSSSRATSTIQIWLCGGASHIDTWDMKPDAPVEFRGEFRPIATTSPAIQLCEHLPRTAQQAHHLAIVRSMGHHGKGTGDHHAGYYYNLTGHEPDPTFPALLNDRKPYDTDWPSIGSVVAARRPARADLPSQVTLPQKPGFPLYTRPGQFSARLGTEYDPVYVLGEYEKPTEFTVPSLSLSGDLTAERMTDRRGLLAAIDNATRSHEGPSADLYSRQQERAFALLTSNRARDAFDFTREPESVRAEYGTTINSNSFLMARRLVEAGVPFVSIFWKEDATLAGRCKSAGGWDTHGNNFNCLRERLLPEFDRAYAALLADLDRRGLLETTLVAVNSEMGRKPRVGDVRSGGTSGAGRDHWTNCMSVLLAGGGIRGGQTFGTSDKFGAYPAEHPVGPEEIARTMFHAMGIEDGEALDREGRPFALLPPGRALTELF